MVVNTVPNHNKQLNWTKTTGTLLLLRVAFMWHPKAREARRGKSCWLPLSRQRMCSYYIAVGEALDYPA